MVGDLEITLHADDAFRALAAIRLIADLEMKHPGLTSQDRLAAIHRMASETLAKMEVKERTRAEAKTPNEVRQEMGLPPVKGEDMVAPLLMQSCIIPINEAAPLRAYEINGADVPSGTIVQVFKPEDGDGYFFQHYAGPPPQP